MQRKLPEHHTTRTRVRSAVRFKLHAGMERQLLSAKLIVLMKLLTQLQRNADSLLRSATVIDAHRETDDVDPERSLATMGERQAATQDSRDGAQRLLAQDLFLLHGLVQRSAAATYKRTTGLADFEWRVLAQLVEHSPITQIEFLPMLSRDKSQVGRTPSLLVGRGLILQTTIGSGRHVHRDVNAQGRAVYAKAAAIALERQASLMTGISAANQRTVMQILDRLIKGAKLLAANP